MPSRQRLHWPQPAWISTVTRWPILYSSTPGPSATTVPMYSCPGVKFLLKAKPPSIDAGGPCQMISRSVAQMATASMRTRTSARLGTGTGFCVSVTWPGSPSTQAFMVSGIGKSGLVFTPADARIRLSYIRYMTSADGSMGRRCFGRQRPRLGRDLAGSDTATIYFRPSPAANSGRCSTQLSSAFGSLRDNPSANAALTRQWACDPRRRDRTGHRQATSPARRWCRRLG